MQVVEERGCGQAEEGAAAPTAHLGGMWGQHGTGAPTNTLTHVQGY